MTSGTLTVSNSIPQISSVSISPSSPTDIDVLTCTWSGYSDADSDADQSTISWTINGTQAGTSSTLSSGFVAGDIVACIVTPDDGEDTGTASITSVSINSSTNALPVVDSISLTPVTVRTDTVIQATVSASDADGDGVILYYSWYVDGILVLQGYGETSLDGAGYFDKGEVVHLDVTPNDGTGNGATKTSPSITVQNSLPSKPTISVRW